VQLLRSNAVASLEFVSEKSSCSLFRYVEQLCVINWIDMPIVLADALRSRYRLSLTNPRGTLHHGKRAANKNGRSV